MLREMSSSKTKACTGSVLASNFNKNVLTRLQEFNYGLDYVTRRASMRAFGVLETTSGACALYRSEVVYYHLDDYVTSGTVGDDRRLCIYSLMEGDVLYVPEALVYTQVPETIKQLWGQRVRWNTGSWKSIPVFMANFGLKKAMFPIIGFISAIFTPVVLFLLVWQSIANTTAVLMHFLAFLIVTHYTHALFYVFARRGWTINQRLDEWLFTTPLLIPFSLFLTIPSKYYALLTLRNVRWRTR
jgi:hyaluronan synthase